MIYDNIPKFEKFLEAHKQGRVSMAECDGYVLFKYKADTQYERDWDDITLHARGIVFDKESGECVVYPFKKFFNLGETGCGLSAIPEDDHEYELLEKLDGSMGCVFLDRNDDLRVITPGAFESDQAVWATNWLRNHKRYNKIKDLFVDGEVTALITEIICPLSKVVVLYNHQGLVLTAAQQFCSVAAGVRYATHNELIDLGDICNLPVCKKFDFESVESVKQYLNEVSNFEGFVLHWPSTGFRLKMKADEYVRNHRILSSVHPNRINEAIEACDGEKVGDFIKVVSEVIAQFPEEHIDPYEKSLINFSDDITLNVNLVSEVKKKYDTPKSLALALQNGEEGDFGKEYFSFIMSDFKNRPYIKNMALKEWDRIREKFFSLESQ